MFGRRSSGEADEGSGRYKVVTISGGRRMASGYGEAVEKRLNEGESNGWKLVNSFAAESMVYLIWDTRPTGG